LLSAPRLDTVDLCTTYALYNAVGQGRQNNNLFLKVVISGVASIGPGQAMARLLDMMADLSNQHTAMLADLMMDIISSNSDREVSSPEIFLNVGPFRSFRTRHVPPPSNEILGSGTGWPDF